jgi:uncharacterized protein involved in oxidation of intracellular sulfur
MTKKLLFVLSKGLEKSGGATRALQFAGIAAESGNEVEVFLIDDAIHWAQIGMADGIYAPTGEKMKDFLDKLIQHRAPIYVCKACADKRLIGPDDIIEGAEIAGAPVLVAKMADPDYKVITF